MLYIVKHRS
jgi:death on curing protein